MGNSGFMKKNIKKFRNKYLPPVRMPWYEAKKPEIIISKESRERIRARMKEISECVANCGVSADRLAQKLREFAESGRPKYTGDVVGTPPEVQHGANVMLPMSEDE